MPRLLMLRYAKSLLGFLLLFLFLVSGRAFADPSDVVAINFSSFAVCNSPSPVGGECLAEGNFAVSFQFDPDNGSIIGSWTATSDLTGGSPFAGSNDGGSASVVLSHGVDTFDFFGQGIDLQLAFSSANFVEPISASVQVCNTEVDCSEGTFIGGVTPEPSSLLLGGTGFLTLLAVVSLGPLIRRRFGAA
jgi:hypothetical protein